MHWFDVTPAIDFEMGIGSWQEAFWQRMEREYGEGIRNACGCYMMVIEEQSGSPVPWYVGKTASKFSGEIFTTDKREKYRRALSEANGTDGKIILYPLCTETERYSRGGEKEISWLEKRLVLQALDANPEIINVSMTRNDRKIPVYGFNAHKLPATRRPGARHSAVKYSLRALGLS